MTRLRTTVLGLASGIVSAGLLAGAAATVGLPRFGGEARLPAARAVRAQFNEINWPFPLDQWGLGRAFRCDPADCGTEVNLYLRAKIGFCNCSTGVSDDPELERVADLEIFSEKYVATAEGHPISIGWMKGRSRPYRVTMHYAPAFDAVAIGFNDKCDVAVATVVADPGKLADAERQAVAFLNGDLTLKWAQAELGRDSD
jgi:hypothetical protein